MWMFPLYLQVNQTSDDDDDLKATKVYFMLNFVCCGQSCSYFIQAILYNSVLTYIDKSSEWRDCQKLK